MGKHDVRNILLGGGILVGLYFLFKGDWPSWPDGGNGGNGNGGNGGNGMPQYPTGEPLECPDGYLAINFQDFLLHMAWLKLRVTRTSVSDYYNWNIARIGSNGTVYFYAVWYPGTVHQILLEESGLYYKTIEECRQAIDVHRAELGW